MAKGESRGVDLMSGNLFLPPREVYSMTPEDRTLDTSLGLLGFTDLLESVRIWAPLTWRWGLEVHTCLLVVWTLSWRLPGC